MACALSSITSLLSHPEYFFVYLLVPSILKRDCPDVNRFRTVSPFVWGTPSFFISFFFFFFFFFFINTCFMVSANNISKYSQISFSLSVQILSEILLLSSFHDFSFTTFPLWVLHILLCQIPFLYLDCIFLLFIPESQILVHFLQ